MIGILFFSAALIILLGMAVRLRNYDPGSVKSAAGKQKWKIPGMEIGFWGADRLISSGRQEFEEEMEMARAVYVRDSPKQKYRDRLAGRLMWVW
ncbi:MAG: hypothetical protein IKN57_06295, partial [Parasporobacterium sp.]|nr:hypothetical protein [Parasporobacterium sp.]